MALLGNLFQRKEGLRSHGNLHTHVYSCFIQNSPKQRVYPGVLQSMNGYTVEHMYCVIHSVTETNYRLKHAVTSMDLRRIRLDEEKVSREGLQHCVMFFTDSLGMRKLWEGDQAWTVRDWGVGGAGGVWVWLWMFTWGSSVMMGTFCTLMYQCQYPGCDMVNCFARC